MGVNKFNAEGYFDPTAYEALTAIEKEAKQNAAFRPVVYICSPLSGDISGNQEKARRYCRFAVDSGYIPLAPHLFFPQFMREDSQAERDLALFARLGLRPMPVEAAHDDRIDACTTTVHAGITEAA